MTQVHSVGEHVVGFALVNQKHFEAAPYQPFYGRFFYPMRMRSDVFMNAVSLRVGHTKLTERVRCCFLLRVRMTLLNIESRTQFQLLGGGTWAISFQEVMKNGFGEFKFGGKSQKRSTMLLDVSCWRRR